MNNRTKQRVRLFTSSVAIAGATAGTPIPFNLQRGYRIHSLDIEFTDLTNAQTFGTVFGDIILMVNDKAMRTHNAAELAHLNNVNGSQYDLQANGTSGTDRTQSVTIYFSEPWRKDVGQADAMAFNCDASWGVNSAKLLLYVAAGQTLSATAGITVWAWVDGLQDASKAPTAGKQILKKVYRTSKTASGAFTEMGKDEFPPTRGQYQAVYFEQPTTSGTIQYLTVKDGGPAGTVIYDKVKNYENWAFLTQRGMNPGVSQSASGFGYDWIADLLDPLQDAVPFTGEGPYFKLEYVSTAAGNIVALSEVLGYLD